MHCPKCGTRLLPALHYHEGEDEFSTNELHWFAEWRCPACGRVVREWEDEFMFVENGLVVPDG